MMEQCNTMDAYILEEVLTTEECDGIVARAAEKGFNRGVFAGNRTRSAFKDEELAAKIWERLKGRAVPLHHDGIRGDFVGDCASVPAGTYVPVGVNPLMRVSEYVQGGQFTRHTDSCHCAGKHFVGMHTVLIYLNEEGIRGGETILYENSQPSMTVKPATGKALVFYHSVEHEGAPVLEGVKRILRTEIMYSLLSSSL
jgi:prolyl 4-hydroxylase